MNGTTFARTLLRAALLITASHFGLSFTAQDASAGGYKIIHTFCEHRNCIDGESPRAPLLADGKGNFFGTTSGGGNAGDGRPGEGSVFELKPDDAGVLKFHRIFSFCRVEPCISGPTGALIIDRSGNLYGIAGNQVYELSAPADGGRWIATLIYTFCSRQNCSDGSSPVDGLTYAGQSSGAPYDGSSPLFGATNAGGNKNTGTVYQLTENQGVWSETVLHSFCSTGGDSCTDGAYPFASIVVGDAGHLYGTTEGGGPHDLQDNGGGAGVVYQLIQDGSVWTETVLHSFCSDKNCSDGAFPLSAPVLDGGGNLIGTTGVGGGSCPLNGKYGCGVVFKISIDGENSPYSVLHTFCKKTDCSDGAQPYASPILDAAGNIFGTTKNGGGHDIDQFGQGGGTAYEISGASYKILHRFCSNESCSDGAYPQVQLTQTASGILLGTTVTGGVSHTETGSGLIFGLKY